MKEDGAPWFGVIGVSAPVPAHQLSGEVLAVLSIPGTNRQHIQLSIVLGARVSVGIGRLTSAFVALAVVTCLVLLLRPAHPTTLAAQVRIQGAQSPATSLLAFPSQTLEIASLQDGLPTIPFANNSRYSSTVLKPIGFSGSMGKFGDQLGYQDNYHDRLISASSPTNDRADYWPNSIASSSNASLLPRIFAVPVLTPTPTPTCNPSWSAVTSPNPSSLLNYLFAIAAISPDDVWAVGTYNIATGIGWTLTLHWDGTQWTQVPSPNPHPDGTNALYGVTAVSSNDVWAVGYTYRSGAGRLTLTEHWDGSEWSGVPSPNPDPFSDYLFSTSAVSSNDMWAAGYYITTVGGVGYRRTLIEHWDGEQWSVVPSPNIGTDNNELTDVSAISSDDAWAVGYYYDTSVHNLRTIVEHWDGEQWSVVPAIHPSNAIDSEFYGVLAISTDDVWAVGASSIASGVGATLTEHWDGTQWSIVNSPNLGPHSIDLFDVSAISSNDVWAVGTYCCDSGAPSINLTEHWNGSQWSIVSSPNPGPSNNLLYGVSAISGSDVWAAGYIGPCPGGPCNWATLIEHYSSPCQTPSPSPSPSPSPFPSPSPTSTRTPSPTPSPTPSRTSTATPSGTPILVTHVTWQNIPQPSHSNITEDLMLQIRPTGGGALHTFTGNTDASGFYTVPAGTLAPGTYNVWAKGARNISTCAVATITGARQDNLEMGTQPAGDADNDNVVNATDFTILKNTFAKSFGQPRYDSSADFDNNDVVNATDFVALKSNFNLPLSCPVP